jgi:hypothetical protein
VIKVDDFDSDELGSRQVRREPPRRRTAAAE